MDVQSNDSDLDGDALTTTILSGPSNGTVAVVNGDSIVYTPNANFNGADTLTYVISDGNGGSDTAIVVITVTPENDSPTISQPPVTVPEDSMITFCPTINDIDAGDILVVSICGGPSNGLVTDNDTCVTYTPTVNFNGQDTLCVVVCDQGGLCDTVIVLITVTPVNDAPIAVDDADITSEDTPITVDVQINDSDIDGDTLTTISILSGPNNGTVVIVSGDSVLYTPALNFNGVDTFVYVISDGNGLTGSATVVITVNPTNDPPLPITDNAVVNEDSSVVISLLLNDSDPDNNIDTSSIAILSNPTNGIASIDSLTGNLTYVPNPDFNGTDTVVYEICDTGLPVYCGSATVIIQVIPVNDPPVAVDDIAATPENVPVIIDVQINDSDLDGDILTTTVISGPFNGSTSILNGDSILYTPNTSYSGLDTLVYVVCDPSGACDTAVVIIDIGGVNDAPVAVDDTVTTNEDTPIMVDVQNNDFDIDSDSLVTTLLSGPNNGTATLANSDSIYYVPNLDFNGSDTLTYMICDFFNACDTAQVVINVIPVNDPPIAVTDSVSTTENNMVSFTILGNDVRC